MRSDLNEIFKMEFLIMVDIYFNISPRIRDLLSIQISKTKSTN